MITMKDLGIVRRLFYRDALSISEIERRTGLTRKTISKWLKVRPSAQSRGTRGVLHKTPRLRRLLRS